MKYALSSFKTKVSASVSKSTFLSVVKDFEAKVKETRKMHALVGKHVLMSDTKLQVEEYPNLVRLLL